MILSATLESKPTDLRGIRLKELRQSTPREAILSEIAKSIALILSDLGLKHMPDSTTQKRIVYYLLKYYGDFTIGEIQTAFELAIIGRLEADIRHYQSFDLAYLSKVLNAYRNHRHQKQRIRLDHARSENTDESSRQSPALFFQHLEEIYLNYLKTGRLEIYIHWIVYNRLLDYSLLEVSENDWNLYFDKATEHYKKRLQHPKTPSQKEKYKSILQDFESKRLSYPFELSRIRNIAKELIVKDFFQSLKDRQINFHELLQKSGIYEQ